MPIESRFLLENITVVSTYGRPYNPATDSSTVFYTEKSKGAGYQKSGDGVHTFVVSTDSFVGTLDIQATLALYPGEDDWFSIYSADFMGDSSNPPDAFNITGNFVWIRAKYHIQDGEINSVRYNY